MNQYMILNTLTVVEPIAVKSEKVETNLLSLHVYQTDFSSGKESFVLKMLTLKAENLKYSVKEVNYLGKKISNQF